MNKFEQWVRHLTPEQFLSLTEQWCGNLPICNGCGKGDGDCRKAFLYWAKQETEEESE